MAVAAGRVEDKTDCVRLVPGWGPKDENTVTCTAAACCWLLLALGAVVGSSKRPPGHCLLLLVYASWANSYQCLLGPGCIGRSRDLSLSLCVFQMDGWDGIRFIPAKIDRYRSIFVSIRARPTAKRETTYTGIPMALFIAAIALPSLSLQGVHASNMCVNLRACMRER